jgi:hypothetical protein
MFRTDIRSIIRSLNTVFTTTGICHTSYSYVVGKPEGRRPLGIPRCRWEDNIKMDLQEVRGARGDGMELAHDRDRWRAHVGTVRAFRVP